MVTKSFDVWGLVIRHNSVGLKYVTALTKFSCYSSTRWMGIGIIIVPMDGKYSGFTEDKPKPFVVTHDRSDLKLGPLRTARCT